MRLPYLLAANVQVLGYHQLDDEAAVFEEFFALRRSCPLASSPRSGSGLAPTAENVPGDALVAGTALVHSLTLVTRNVEDFQWIQGSALDP